MLRVTSRLLATLVLFAGFSGTAFGQMPKLETLLAQKPIQNVTVTMPTPAEFSTLRVEAGSYGKNELGKPVTGYVVKDATGRLVRQLIDTKGTGTPNLVYFYNNGLEAYREIDANGNGKPDQFRWLGVNGSKWGFDADEDGVVDSWYVISQEELSQEVFSALQSRNPKRLEALLPTAKDLQSLGLPAAEVEKLQARSVGAVKKMMETANALALTEKSRWVHVEFGLPNAVAADAFGGKDDLVKQSTGLVLYDKGDGKTADVFTIGEMVLVGKAWKLLDGPTPGAVTNSSPATMPAGVAVIPAAAQPYLAKLQAVKPATTPAEMRRYHLERAEILEKIVGETKGEDQQPWLKQVIDSYSAAIDSNLSEAKEPMARLTTWTATINREAPRTSAAAYADFRLAGSEYTQRATSAKPNQIEEVQKWWREQLEAFVTKHPASEETPEAMMRLASSFEFASNGESDARKWYEKLATAFPGHPNAMKAQGAVRRLQSEGQPFTLPVATTLDGKSFNFNVTAGKPTIVFYWANYNTNPVAEERVISDLRALASLAKPFGDKVNIVTISVDDDPARAVAAINAAGLPGAHLHMPGGLDRSPLAVAYGIQMVPHAILVDKAGKVANRNAQNGMLRDELEKLVK
jgi:TolA-binding protein